MKREETQGKGGTEMWRGKVVAIFVAPEAAAPMKSVLEVKAVPAKVLKATDTSTRLELTLTEAVQTEKLPSLSWKQLRLFGEITKSL